MWCPRCNKEYPDDQTMCPKCGCELDDYSPILNQEERDMMMSDSDKPKETLTLPEELEPELLVSVVGEGETLRLVALLEGLRIPCIYRLTQDDSEEEVEEIEYEDFDYEDDLPEEDFVMEEDDQEIDEPIYDILIPQAMIPKALRILNDDSHRHQEQLVEEENLPEFEGKEYVEYSPFDDYDDQEEPDQQEDQFPEESNSREEPEKRKGFFGFFGKK